MNLKERVVTGMFFAMLFLVPKALDTATPFILYHGSGNIDEIAHMRDWEWDIGAEQKLLKKTEENTEDPEPYLSLGIYYKKKDDAQGAVSMLEKALAKKPGMARALINLGNAHFAAGRLDKAIECYRQAIGSEDKYASAHYNLGFSLLKKNPLSTEGNNEVEKSKVMNRPRIEAHEGIFSPIIANRCMLDEEISNGELWARLLAPSDARKRLNAWIWRWLVTGLSLENSYILPAGFLALCFAFLVLGTLFPFSKACEECGKAVCARCQKEASGQRLCSQCYFVYRKREGLDPQTILQKEREILSRKMRRKVITRAVSFILLGSGHIAVRDTIKGSLMLLSFICLLVYGFLWGYFIRPPMQFTQGTSLLFLVSWIGALAVLYFLGIRSIIKRR
jgi:tetratricopeptide (TPR) repeat protein